MTVSTESVAIIAASGAILGALVGASAGGIVNAKLDRIRERRDARAGARLVRADLDAIAQQLEEAEATGRWFCFFSAQMKGWEAHRVSLSARLDEPDLRRVTRAVMELERFHVDMVQAALEPGTTYRDVAANHDALRRMRQNATDAYNVLSHEAKGKNTSGILPTERR